MAIVSVLFNKAAVAVCVPFVGGKVGAGGIFDNQSLNVLGRVFGVRAVPSLECVQARSAIADFFQSVQLASNVGVAFGAVLVFQMHKGERWQYVSLQI